MAKIERVYTVPLGEAYTTIRQKKAKRAVNLMQAFLQRHMKSDNVRLSNALNALLWRDGIQKPPRRVRIKAIKDEAGMVRAYLVDEKVEEKKEEKPAEKTTKEVPKVEKKKSTNEVEKK